MADLSTFVKVRHQPTGPVETFSQERAVDTIPTDMTTDDAALILLRPSAATAAGSDVPVADEDLSQGERLTLQHPTDEGRRRVLERAAITRVEPLLVHAVVDGERVGPAPSIDDMRALREADLACLHPGVKRLMNPHPQARPPFCDAPGTGQQTAVSKPSSPLSPSSP